jgi:hypothetical protein
MIIVEKPKVKQNVNEIVISFTFSIDGLSQNLWYSVPLEYKEYLVIERLDTALVGLLFLGLQRGEDIHIKGGISSRLFYTLNHYLIDALVLGNKNFQKIKISAEELNSSSLNVGNIAGTGLSCGIDSLATYFNHSTEKEPFAIEYFTFFNVGSHGDFGGDKSRRIFNRRLRAVEKFAHREGKKIIPVDSNLSEILRMNFQQTHTLRNVCAVLLLQKLFKNYYYASAYRLDYFRLNPFDTSDSDIFNLSMLSTESTAIFSSVANMTRIERTELVSQRSETYDILDVCTNLEENAEVLNCTNCEKCLRTALTLDLLGKLNLYERVFDLKKYKVQKDAYVGKLLSTKKSSLLNREICDLLYEKDEIKLKHFYFAANSLSNRKIKVVKNFFKKYLTYG